MQYDYSHIDRSRIYSSLFSRRMLDSVLLRDRYDMLDEVIALLDSDWLSHAERTYADFLSYSYACMMRDYRCEYVYKNEVINKILLRHFSHESTCAFNEFRVNQSIADLAMFNGTSRAFEIKTEYDSERRMFHQLDDYQKLFEKCYLVVSADCEKRYASLLPSGVGLVTLEHRGRTMIHHVVSEATLQTTIDVPTMMRSVRTEEYKEITRLVCGNVPDVSAFDMFETCEELLCHAENSQVNKAFIRVIKQRKCNAQLLPNVQTYLRQLCLSYNIGKEDYFKFQDKLLVSINKG